MRLKINNNVAAHFNGRSNWANRAGMASVRKADASSSSGAFSCVSFRIDTLGALLKRPNESRTFAERRAEEFDNRRSEFVNNAWSI